MGLKKNNPGCNCCEFDCGFCDSGSAPTAVVLTFSGWSSATYCSSCSWLDGSWHLPSKPLESGAGQCYYEQTWAMGEYQCDGEDVEIVMWARVKTDPNSPFDIMWEANVAVTRHDWSLANRTRTSMNYRWNSGEFVTIDCYATRTLPENSAALTNVQNLCDAPASVQLSS